MTCLGTSDTLGERIPRKTQNTSPSTANIFSRSCSSRFLPTSKDQIPIKGRRYASPEEVKIHATRGLREVTKYGLQECFVKWYEHWDKLLLPRGRTLNVVLCKKLHVIYNKGIYTSSVTF